MSQSQDPIVAGQKADALIAAEVAIQDKMWGVANDRADATDRQMMAAAMAQLDLVALKRLGKLESHTALKLAYDDFYPKDWDGFRDYGSDVANLVVAAAFLRSEIKRLIAAGEDTTRAKREESQSYPGRNVPNMSSEEAARG